MKDDGGRVIDFKLFRGFALGHMNKWTNKQINKWTDL